MAYEQRHEVGEKLSHVEILSESIPDTNKNKKVLSLSVIFKVQGGSQVARTDWGRDSHRQSVPRDYGGGALQGLCLFLQVKWEAFGGCLAEEGALPDLCF